MQPVVEAAPPAQPAMPDNDLVSWVQLVGALKAQPESQLFVRVLEIAERHGLSVAEVLQVLR